MANFRAKYIKWIHIPSLITQNIFTNKKKATPSNLKFLYDVWLEVSSLVLSQNLQIWNVLLFYFHLNGQCEWISQEHIDINVTQKEKNTKKIFNFRYILWWKRTGRFHKCCTMFVSSSIDVLIEIANAIRFKSECKIYTTATTTKNFT